MVRSANQPKGASAFPMIYRGVSARPERFQTLTRRRHKRRQQTRRGTRRCREDPNPHVLWPLPDSAPTSSLGSMVSYEPKDFSSGSRGFLQDYHHKKHNNCKCDRRSAVIKREICFHVLLLCVPFSAPCATVPERIVPILERWQIYWLKPTANHLEFFPVVRRQPTKRRRRLANAARTRACREGLLPAKQCAENASNRHLIGRLRENSGIFAEFVYNSKRKRTNPYT